MVITSVNLSSYPDIWLRTIINRKVEITESIIDMKKAVIEELPKNIPSDSEKKPVDIIITENNGTHIVDTSLNPYTKIWETNIFLDNKEQEQGIAETYHHKEDAINGHKKWVEKVKENPNSIW